MRTPLVLALAALVSLPAQQPLTLEFRVFLGEEDVTGATRITVHRAGQREQPLGQLAGTGPRMMKVPPGIYDAQAMREEVGRVLNIKWAERLVVMPYPDEDGHHLEVINLVNGYGALQVRGAAGRQPDAEIALFTPEEHGRPAALSRGQNAYVLFVVRAGPYDVPVKRGTRTAWHTGVEVPADRTRLWIVP